MYAAVGREDLRTPEHMASLREEMAAWAWCVRVSMKLEVPDEAPAPVTGMRGVTELSEVNDYDKMWRRVFMLHRINFGASGMAMYYFWAAMYFGKLMDRCVHEYNCGLAAVSQSGHELSHEAVRGMIKHQGAGGKQGKRELKQASTEPDADFAERKRQHALFWSQANSTSFEGPLLKSFWNLYEHNVHNWLEVTSDKYADDEMTIEWAALQADGSVDQGCYLALIGRSDLVTPDLIDKIRNAVRPSNFRDREQPSMPRVPLAPVKKVRRAVDFSHGGFTSASDSELRERAKQKYICRKQLIIDPSPERDDEGDVGAGYRTIAERAEDADDADGDELEAE